MNRNKPGVFCLKRHGFSPAAPPPNVSVALPHLARAMQRSVLRGVEEVP